ncbi:MobV family relaxase [Carnobacterium maltaromaticum]|uniref:MobV family relaxase n=1 Tax=Carnobacterium maltaromaticum TaxID=2751 RepID=UPI0039BEC87E
MGYTLHGSHAESRPTIGGFFMSMVVARMQKMKAPNLIGLGNHNQRKTDNHSNKEIDVSRSSLNYDLVDRTYNYKTDIERYINENKSSPQAVRKDAVLVNEWIISSDSAFFKGLDENQTRQFFHSARNYFGQKYGDQNIRYAQVHMDERTPHMHLGIVPFTEDKRLSAKTIFNRQALQTIQEDFPKYLKEQGFDIERGQEHSDKKHLSVDEYKKLKDRTELKELQEAEKELAEKNQISQSELKKVKKNYGELEQEYGVLVAKAISADKEVKDKEKELIQFGFRDNHEIEKKPILLRKGYSAVKTSDLEQLEKDAGLSVLANKKYEDENTKRLVAERKLKVVEDDNKVLKRELGVTQNKLAATHKKLSSFIDEFTDQWSFAKEYVKQAFDKNLDGMYTRFQKIQEEKQQETYRKSSRDDLSR